MKLDTSPPTAPTRRLLGTHERLLPRPRQRRSTSRAAPQAASPSPRAARSTPHSGVAGYTYPALGTGWTHTAGDYSFTTRPPAPTAATSPRRTTPASRAPARASPRRSTRPRRPAAIQCNTRRLLCRLVHDLARRDRNLRDRRRASAGVKQIKYTTDGTNPTSSGTATTVNAATAGFNITTLGTTTVKWIAEDNVGNVSAVSSQDVKLDSTAPSAPTGSPSRLRPTRTTRARGTTVYFQGGSTGGFTVSASGSTDAESGIAGYTYPARSSGWSHTDGAYSFDAAADRLRRRHRAERRGPLEHGHELHGAGRLGRADELVQCNAAACSAGWYTTSPVAIAIGATDGGSDVKRITYTTDGTDPSSSGTATTVNAATRASTSRPSARPRSSGSPRTTSATSPASPGRS